MKYYAVAEIEITDRGWVSAYVKNVTKLVEEYGGRDERTKRQRWPRQKDDVRTAKGTNLSLHHVCASQVFGTG